MSRLKGKINRLVRNNFVYFPPADLAAIRDQFKGYVEDNNGSLEQYKSTCRELETCLHADIADGSDNYQSKLHDTYKQDENAYFAWMYQVYSGLYNDNPEGLYLCNAEFISVLFRKLDDARRYFKQIKKEAA